MKKQFNIIPKINNQTITKIYLAQYKIIVD